MERVQRISRTRAIIFEFLAQSCIDRGWTLSADPCLAVMGMEGFIGTCDNVRGGRTTYYYADGFHCLPTHTFPSTRTPCAILSQVSGPRACVELERDLPGLRDPTITAGPLKMRCGHSGTGRAELVATCAELSFRWAQVTRCKGPHR